MGEVQQYAVKHGGVRLLAQFQVSSLTPYLKNAFYSSIVDEIAIVKYKMLSESEPFGLIPPGNQFDFVNIDIFRYGCKITITCPEFMYEGFPVASQIVNLPCTKKACCKMSFVVRKKSNFCQVEGYSGSQKDYSMVSPRCNPLYNDVAESEGET